MAYWTGALLIGWGIVVGGLIGYRYGSYREEQRWRAAAKEEHGYLYSDGDTYKVMTSMRWFVRHGSPKGVDARRE